MGCNARDKLRRNTLRSNRSTKHANLEILPKQTFPIPSSLPLDGNFDHTAWAYCNEDQLQEMLLRRLQYFYNQAMSKLVALGYDQTLSLNALLRNGHCYGTMDALSNILHNSLAYLTSSDADEEPQHELLFENLRQLEGYSLAGMVCLLQQVRPQLSKGDAMWCLLMSDLHVGRASSIEPPFAPWYGSSNDVVPDGGGNGVNAGNNLNGISPANCKFHGGWGFGSGDGNDFGFNGSFQSSSFDAQVGGTIECPKRFNLPPELQSMLQRNVTMFAAGFKANAKRSQMFGRPAAVGVAPETQAPSGNSDVIKTKWVRSFGNAVGVALETEVPIENSEGFRQIAKQLLRRAHVTGRSAVRVTSSDDASAKSEVIQDSQTADVVSSVLSSLGNLSLKEKVEDGTSDQKNEIILNLIHQIKDLDGQVKERKEWAHQKAMQAARKLNQDLTELKLLRMEREETQRLKGAKQTLEDTTMTRLSEMENALRKASGQVDLANAAVRRLETENAEIRSEMEASKLSASESVTTCLEVAKKEKRYLKKLLAWEKQKNKLQEEVTEEKQKISQLQEQLALIKDAQKETEVNWRQELKAKELAIVQVEEERRAKEAIEVSAKRKMETLRRKIELDFQRHKDDIQRLEHELSRLKASVESTPTNYQPNVICPGDSNISKTSSEANSRILHELNQFLDSSDKEMDYDRKCIICLKDEVSVVFLPCAHQVLCSSCSQDYGKKGRASCPCCRVPIEQRICVYGTSS